MESDELQSQLTCQRRGGLNVLPVLFPGCVRGNPARLPDRFERAVVLADATKHAGDNRDSFLTEERGGLAPNFGRVAQRIQGELNAADAGILQFGDEILWIRRLQRPTAHGKALCQRFSFHVSFVICDLLLAIRYSLFAICQLRFALRPLPFAIRPQATTLRRTGHSPLDENWSSLFLKSKLNVVSEP